MGKPYFVQAPAAQTADTYAYFIIGVEHGAWGNNTKVTCTDDLGHVIVTYPTGGADFAMQFDGPYAAGAHNATFAFENEKTGEVEATLGHSWEVVA